MGGVIFIDLRDREGILQVVFDGRNLTPEAFAAAEALKLESVIAVEGPLRIRGEETYNPKLVTGTIELAAKKLEVLSEAAALPFSMSEAGNVREELRLQYRFLDLRRPKLLNNLKFRHRLTKLIHDYLDGQGFLQVETPMLTKSTPEGARDYLVPSRVHQGMFYALPQSPQIFKQLLMVGGVDKYYQIARCFRDEDLRADRQPEFTQVDMELSFVDQEDILEHLEKMFKHLFREALGVEFQEPFPRLTWQQAMDRYGSDKPDLRFGLPIVDLTQQLKGCGFSVFRKAIDEGGMVRAVNVKGHGNFTRSAIEELTEKALKLGAKGMAWIALKDDGEPYSILTKYFSQEEFQSLLDAVDGKPGDFILFCADQVIDGIVPIVGTTYPDEHLLKGYFDSLEKLKHQYGDCLILPAHKEPIRDVKRVVDRIVFAYLDKTDLIKHILDHGHHRMTTKEVACLAYGIDHVPGDQSEFIKLKMVISKTFSCLEYLYDEDFAIRKGDWKLVYNDQGSTRKIQLFDMKDDKEEVYDLSGEYPELADSLLAEFDAWDAALPPCTNQTTWNGRVVVEPKEPQPVSRNFRYKEGYRRKVSEHNRRIYDAKYRRSVIGESFKLPYKGK